MGAISQDGVLGIAHSISARAQQRAAAVYHISLGRADKDVATIDRPAVFCYHTNKKSTRKGIVLMYDAMISRPFFTNWLAKWRDKDVIKVVSGIRRCGKTTLFDLFKNQLKEDGVAESQIVSINFESPNLPDFKTWHEAWEYIKGKVDQSGKTYIFLDEVQLVPDHFP